jgi:hypothetical protein
MQLSCQLHDVALQCGPASEQVLLSSLLKGVAAAQQPLADEVCDAVCIGCLQITAVAKTLCHFAKFRVVPCSANYK